MKKRLLALCMSLCLLVGLLPTAAWAADTQAENASGFCDAEENGESVKWELSPDEDDSSAYTLTISIYRTAATDWADAQTEVAFGQAAWNVVVPTTEELLPAPELIVGDVNYGIHGSD